MFHFAIQQMRWTHARLVARPQHMFNLIRDVLEATQDPNSLVNLKRIESVSIIVPPDPVTLVSETRMDWALADDIKYLSFSPPELSSQFLQLLNILGNKEQCPQLKHITFDPSGVGRKQIDRFNGLQSTDLHPINVQSLRIKGNSNFDATYRLIEKCMATQLQTLHISHSLAWGGIKKILSLDHWLSLRKLHFVADGNTYELEDEYEIRAPVLEWLSIDGWDYDYREDSRRPKTSTTEERARLLAKVCPGLKRLAITWRSDHSQAGVRGYVEPRAGFLETARPFFEANPSLELMTFRYIFPRLMEVRRVGGRDLELGTRDAVRRPRKDGWPTICP